MTQSTHSLGLWATDSAPSIADIESGTGALAGTHSVLVDQEDDIAVSHPVSYSSAGTYDLEWVARNADGVTQAETVSVTIPVALSTHSFGAWNRMYNPTIAEIEAGTNAVAGTHYSLADQPDDAPVTQAIALSAPGLYDLCWAARNADGVTQGNTAAVEIPVAPVAPSWPTGIPDIETTALAEDLYAVNPFLNNDVYPPPTYALTGTVPTGFAIDDQNIGTVRKADTVGAGSYSVEVTATNPAGSGSASFTWAASGATGAPNWTSDIPNQFDDVDDLPAYGTFSPLCDGNPAPTFSLISPPDGFSMIDVDTCHIAVALGTAAGDYPITCRATNPEGTDDSSFVWYIRAVPLPPEYGDRTSYNGVAVNLDAKTGWQYLVGDEVWSATGLPTGLSIASDTGLVTGTPSANGDFITRVTANDGTAYTASPFTWTIKDVPPAPEGGAGAMNLNLNLMI